MCECVTLCMLLGPCGERAAAGTSLNMVMRSEMPSPCPSPALPLPCPSPSPPLPLPCPCPALLYGHQVQGYEGVSASYEAACWGVERAVAATGEVVPWDVIHFNEGLHSLWPRTNTTDGSGVAWAGALANWTRVLGTAPGPGVPAPTLVYATMTPMMAAHWCVPSTVLLVELKY